jgi:hypothetical protein
MKTEMEQLRKVEYEKTALEYFDIISYLDSKLRGKRFIDVLRIKNEKET